MKKHGGVPMKSFSEQLIDDINDKQTEDMFNDG
jgi:hypothetical protein